MKKMYLIPVLLLILLCTNSLFAELVWVPAEYANAKKGDIMLQGDPDNFIGKLLAIFGGYWSHSGMMIDDYNTIRHNTMDINQMRQDKTWLGIPWRLNPYDLENGPPGTINTTVDEAYTSRKWEINTATDVVLTLADVDENSLRPKLHEIADKMKSLDMFYRIHSYINEDVQDWLDQFSTTRVAGKGGHCSGTVWYANYLLGKQMNLFYASPSIVDAGAKSLYESVRQMVRNQMGIGTAFLSHIAVDIANQVVNGFGLDVYDDLNDTWRNHLGKVHTFAVAPDHLLLDTIVNPEGNTAGVQTAGTSYYRKIQTIQLTGGYWIDTDTVKTASVILYDNTNYGGASEVKFGAGQWNLNNFNDRISSLKVSANYIVSLYKHSNFGGGVYQYVGSNSSIPINDWASSIKVEAGDNQRVMTFFEHGNYLGHNVSYYSEIDCPELGSNDNMITSIRVAPGWQVTVYEHGNYGGWSKTITADTPDMAALSQYGGYNDSVSSFKIRRQ